MATTKYLQRYAEVECTQLALPQRNWQQVLVIPAYREPVHLLDRLEKLLASAPNTLVILVINQPDNQGPTVDALDQAIRQRYSSHDGEGWARWHGTADNSTLLVIDRFSEGRAIPHKQGVGLARKIGCDIACRLIDTGNVHSPWIFSSDADVSWPADYFTAANAAASNSSALLYPFKHCSAAGQNPIPIALYEFSLHYYVAGLRWAGSPYAFHTIGSILAIDHQHYARVRGFPKRSGAEDFYLLNKLAKTGTIEQLPAPLIRIHDRESDRVPFGTGPARHTIAGLDEPLRQYPLYHPACFTALRQALETLKYIASTDCPLKSWQQTLADKPIHTAPALYALDAMGIADAIEHAARHSHSSDGFNRHLHNWLDGFRTLKCIHSLRDQHYSSSHFEELMKGENFARDILKPHTTNLMDDTTPAGQAKLLDTCNALWRRHLQFSPEH